MSGPVRIQLKRTKGWRLPADTVVVSRPSAYGNPFVEFRGRIFAAPLSVHFECRPAKDVADAYRLWLEGKLLQAEAQGLYRERRVEILRLLPRLRGQNLACWCRIGSPCHADVLLEIANATQEKKP